ncbi:hypothetical protein HYH02_003945 [Chlamydomonas schloesseri]|uniref:Uncharacterized protein n=1 Tax=Chlamydomonas schloesseri TaxID=2026947 RepID=A0A836B905_9CHLO|nr:hypothetical protein HYH02_003945 [Chlamydomonas schloesseri]|eukprot:KAG2451341.1 hypothetical protein HYH02_003945 [Chlamydomonas schloesseri]
MKWGELDWGLPLSLPNDEGGKEVPSVLKAEEEIAKFTVDEHLSDVERTVLYLNGGQLIQQRHAIANLPTVLKGRGRPAFDAISQPLKAALNRLDSDAQIATAEAFATIARERLLSPVDLQVCILPTVTRNINREKSEEETDAWLNTLFELIPLLDKEVLKTEVLSLALSKGDVEGVVGSKTICVRILGALAPRLTWEEIERSFFKKALSMCQDVDHHIRIASCSQLGAIARIAGRDVVAKTILPELFELLNDEEVQPRVASLTTLTSILDLVPPEVRKGQVMPILRNHMQPLELDIVMQRCVARVFGPLVTVVKVDFEHDDSVLFFSCYKHLATKADVELRKLCASQLPAVLRAATALTAAAFSQQFQDTLNNLATDQDVEVRKTLAGLFHEVARVVGKDCVQLLTRPLCRLLRDESLAVQAVLLPNLTATLAHWSIRDEARRDAAMGELAKALLELESGAKRNWRLQQQLAASFPMFPQVFSSDQIYEYFMPLAFRYLTDTAAVVRPVAAEGLVCFLRYNRREKQRAEVLLRIVREFCRGKSYTARLTFVDIATHFLRRFSSRFVKDYIFDLVLELLYDPVPNVRLTATGLLPSLKQCIRLPEDVDLLERLNSAMSNIMTDNDRDVSQNARATNEQFKKTPMRMGGAGGGMLDMNGTMGGGSGTYGGAPAAVSNEADDRRKEEEELDFTFTADDLKEIKSEMLQVGPTKNKTTPGGATLAGKSGVQRRPGGLTPVGGYDRSSNSGGAGMANRGGGAFGPGGAAGSGQRRPGAGASEDGSGRGGLGSGPLGGMRGVGGSGTGGSVSMPNSRISSAASSASGAASKTGFGISGPASLSSPSKPGGPASRMSPMPAGGAKPSSPLLSSSPGVGGPGAQSGVRLPAITTRASSASAPSPVLGSSSALSKPGSGGAMGAGSRLTTGTGAAAGAGKTPLTTASTVARKPTR